MKKQLFLLGVAVAALASCTNEEVVYVAQNRAIQFGSFVNNTTKAVDATTTTEVEGGAFYVIGYWSADATTYNTTDKVHKNELASSVTYYWEDNKYYAFGAYKDGTIGTQLAGAEFVSADLQLKISDYVVGNKDLVGAVSSKIGPVTAATQQAVPLTFKHLLSQVQFKFTTDEADGYTINITDVKFTTFSKGTCIHTASATTWQAGTDTNEFNFGDVQNITNETTNGIAGPVLVLPHQATNLEVSFKASIEGNGIIKKEKDITVTLASIDWMPNNRYQYSTVIKMEHIAEAYPIEFTSTVSDWDTDFTNNTDVTPDTTTP